MTKSQAKGDRGPAHGWGVRGLIHATCRLGHALAGRDADIFCNVHGTADALH